VKKIYEKIKNNPLWSGIGQNDFEHVLNCLSAKVHVYKKEDVILFSGSAVNFVGLVLEGSVQVIKEDIDGNTTILTELGVSEFFGETFACAEITQSPVTIVAAENAEILLIDYKKIITSCSSACVFHAKLIENMLKIIARKNLMLTQKLDILSKRTTREKLLTFLETQKGTAKKFTIPYNREQLAQYLCVERSAMSNELGKLRNEGLIRFRKNEFEILRPVSSNSHTPR